MEIRKLFRFENSHIVRNCSSDRCKFSIHGHSYIVELFLTAHSLDNGQMIYDFGLLKGPIKDLIESFDHSIALWSKDDPNYISSMQQYSKRWVVLPVSPSAEQLSRVIFLMCDRVLTNTRMNNGEDCVELDSVIVHETATGYARSFREDLFNIKMGLINLTEIIFSEAVREEWSDKDLWQKLISANNPVVINPTVEKQVK